ncbi:MAG: hypothetical protein H8D87_05055 [Deltaproteobacteria bacterium]|uniref:ABC transporter substrate-binding protein n=1 Tax=Desulfobacula sp. TaxID=2593537 RepID=UPI0019AD0D5D|nr:hypothetical protein [Candidatus Desulfobacula maris]MBL6994722.1 hypothetical protein [Desulfobacula sp.]
MIIRYVFILLFCLIPLSSTLAGTIPPDVCVVISREIRPFVMMADEMENSLDFPVTRVYLDSSYRPYGENGKFREILESDFNLFIAVGPRALTYLLQQKITTQIIYGMVVSPESFINSSNTNVSGVSLNIFSLTQLTIIKQVFPDIQKIGVLYDPKNNKNWFNSASFLARASEITLVSLDVSDSSMIPAVLEEKAKDLDAVLFIPDATVISTTIIKHTIKQLILRKIPAIGYNNFFSESGAALSFVIDYQEVGKQVANLIYTFLNEKKKVSIGPIFMVRLNPNVIKLLNLKLNHNLPENIKFKK